MNEQPRPQVDEPVITISEFAKRAHVARSTVNRWLHTGQIKCYRMVGGRRWIPVDELRRVGSASREDKHHGG